MCQQVKEDKGPITFGGIKKESATISDRISESGFYDCVPKKGEETTGVIRMEAHRQDLSPCWPFKEGGSTTLVKLAQYFRDGGKGIDALNDFIKGRE